MCILNNGSKVNKFNGLGHIILKIGLLQKVYTLRLI